MTEKSAEEAVIRLVEPKTQERKLALKALEIAREGVNGELLTTLFKENPDLTNTVVSSILHKEDLTEDQLSLLQTYLTKHPEVLLSILKVQRRGGKIALFIINNCIALRQTKVALGTTESEDGVEISIPLPTASV